MDDLEEIGIHTQQEKPFQILIEYICNGWPTQKVKWNPIVQPCWNDHPNMKFIWGLLVKREKIDIATVLRRDMLKGIHGGHMSIKKCKRRAR